MHARLIVCYAYAKEAKARHLPLRVDFGRSCFTLEVMSPMSAKAPTPVSPQASFLQTGSTTTHWPSESAEALQKLDRESSWAEVKGCDHISVFMAGQTMQDFDLTGQARTTQERVSSQRPLLYLIGERKSRWSGRSAIGARERERIRAFNFPFRKEAAALTWPESLRRVEQLPEACGRPSILCAARGRRRSRLDC